MSFYTLLNNLEADSWKFPDLRGTTSYDIAPKRRFLAVRILSRVQYNVARTVGII